VGFFTQTNHICVGVGVKSLLKVNGLKGGKPSTATLPVLLYKNE